MNNFQRLLEALGLSDGKIYKKLESIWDDSKNSTIRNFRPDGTSYKDLSDRVIKRVRDSKIMAAMDIEKILVQEIKRK